MTINLSLQIAPSRTVRWCLYTLQAALVVVACWLWQANLPWPWPASLSVMVLLAAFWVWRRGHAHLRPFGLTILPGGQIVLTPERQTPRRVRLRHDSTLWPQGLFLRLQEESGQVHSLLVLPDTLPAGEFRALLVSCHWLVVKDLPEKKL